MTDINRPDDVQHYDVGDAEKIVPAGGFEFVPGPGAFSTETEKSTESAVPAVPPHICPTCDYNLRGLTSRRCPECGKPFTLLDARRRGSEKSEETRQDMRVVRILRTKFIVGAVLYVGGYIWALVSLISGPGFQIWIVTSVLVTASIIILMYKIFFQKDWSHAMMLAGLVSIAIGSVFGFF